MRILLLGILISFAPSSYAETEIGKVCLNIPGRGISTEKIKQTCSKGDLIKVDEKNMPFLCDFNFAIAPYVNNFACVYSGERRELREGTNF